MLQRSGYIPKTIARAYPPLEWLLPEAVNELPNNPTLTPIILGINYKLPNYPNLTLIIQFNTHNILCRWQPRHKQPC